MFDPPKQPYGLPVAAGEYVPGPARPYGYAPHQQPQNTSGIEPDEPFDPLKLFFYFIHYRWLIAACMAAGLVGGVLFTWMQTPLYRATTNMEVLTAGSKVLKELEVISQSTNEYREFETARLKILSRELARRVVYELALADDKTFLAPTPRFSIFNLVNRSLGRDTQSGLEDLSAERREAIAIATVQGGLTVSIVRNTSILSIDYSHPDPDTTAKIANQVTRSFIEQGVDKRSETSDLARQFIEERVEEAKKKLQQSEQALADYAKSAAITLTGDDVSLIDGNIADLNKALAESIQERLTAERFMRQVTDGDAATLPEVFESDSIQTTRQKIAELKANYQEKLATLKPGFPEMRSLQAQIGELQKQVNAEVKSIARSVEIKFEQAKEKEASLIRELATLESRQSEFRDKNIQYSIRKREVDSNRTQYESLIAKLNEVGVGSELKSTNASVVDEAIRPALPYSPRLSIMLMIALAMAGAVATAIIYVLELLNNTFMVPDQIESDLKLSVLGIIPKVDDAEIMDAFKDSKSSLSEAYRSLRTSLQFSGAEGTIRTLVITSSVPSEGKSTTAYKLAHDFAALGRKVLVIDADLRRPRLHRVFNTDNTIGLSNLLSNVVRQGDVVSIFRRTADANVTFLSAGTIPPNPADLLTSQKMAMTLHYCAKKYDLVIIDSPPVMGLSDAPILSRQADATLLVVSSKQVTRKAAKGALARLKSAGGNVIGAAMTKFAVNQLDYNYAYRYMQYNYYSYDSEQARIEDNAASKPVGNSAASRPAGFVANLIGRLRGNSD